MTALSGGPGDNTRAGALQNPMPPALALVSGWPTLREGGRHGFLCMNPTIEEIRRKVAEPRDPGREVDVVTRGSLHPKLRDQILRELVPVL